MDFILSFALGIVFIVIIGAAETAAVKIIIELEKWRDKKKHEKR